MTISAYKGNQTRPLAAILFQHTIFLIDRHHSSCFVEGYIGTICAKLF